MPRARQARAGQLALAQRATLVGADIAERVHPIADADEDEARALRLQDRKSTRLNSSHLVISYAVFCLKKKKKKKPPTRHGTRRGRDGRGMSTHCRKFSRT